VRTHATTVSLWTSRPAHRSTTTSIASFPAPLPTSNTRAAREQPHSCRILTLVLAATVRCSRGSRVRLNDGLSHTKEIPTSPERPTHSFHALCAAPPGARVTKWKYNSAVRVMQQRIPSEGHAHRDLSRLAASAWCSREAPGSGLGSRTRCGYLCHPRCSSRYVMRRRGRM